MTHTSAENIKNDPKDPIKAALENLGEKVGGTGKKVLEAVLNAKEQLAKSELGAFFEKGLALLVSLGILGAEEDEDNPSTNEEEKVYAKQQTQNPAPDNTKVKYEYNNHKIESSTPFLSYKELYKGKDTTIGLKGNELRENPQFKERFIEIANHLKVNPEHLSVVIFKESRFNPLAYNNSSGATGLIQWLPSVAKAFGTSTDEIKNMSGLEQLDWVYQFYKKYTGKLTDAFSLYLATFYPAALRKGEDFIFGSEKNKGSDGLDRARAIAARNPIGVRYGGPFDPKYPGDPNRRLIDKASFRRYVAASKLS